MAEPARASDLLARLPPGRHGLPPEFVSANQRARISAGTIAAVGRHGYHETTIAGIAAAAGVSRRTFYKYFDSKESCFEATLREIAAHLDRVASKAGRGERVWARRVRAELAAVLAVFGENPNLARCTLITPAGAGAAINDRYRKAVRAVRKRITVGRPAGTRPSSKVAIEIAVDGLIVLISDAVESGRGGELPTMVDDFHQFLLVTYLSTGVAMRAAADPEE